MEQKIYTTSEIAKREKMDRDTILCLIRKKRIKAEKILGRWAIKLEDFEAYKKSKYTPGCRVMKSGKPLFDREKNEMSLKEAANYLGLPITKLYYMIKKKWIQSRKKKGYSSYIFTLEDLKAFKESRK